MSVENAYTAALILLLPVMAASYIGVRSDLSRTMRTLGFVLAGAMFVSGLFVVYGIGS